MKMDEHARAWAHEFVANLLNTTSLPPEQRNSLHWEILSHLHEKAERRVEARNGSFIALADLQATVADVGGRDGLAAAFLQTRVVATPRAGFGKRLGAFVIDAVILFFGLGFLGMVMFEGLFIRAGSVFDDVAPVLWFGLAWAYFTIAEMKFGATIGKLAFKLRTVMVDGRPVTPEAAMIRNIAKAVPPLLIIDTLLYLLAFSKEDQRASDRLANTIVIDTARTSWAPAPVPPMPAMPASPVPAQGFIPVDEPASPSSGTPPPPRQP